MISTLAWQGGEWIKEERWRETKGECSGERWKEKGKESIEEKKPRGEEWGEAERGERSRKWGGDPDSRHSAGDPLPDRPHGCAHPQRSTWDFRGWGEWTPLSPLNPSLNPPWCWGTLTLRSPWCWSGWKVGRCSGEMERPRRHLLPYSSDLDADEWMVLKSKFKVIPNKTRIRDSLLKQS